MRANAVIVVLLLWACDTRTPEPDRANGAGGSQPRSAGADAGAGRGAGGSAGATAASAGRTGTGRAGVAGAPRSTGAGVGGSGSGGGGLGGAAGGAGTAGGDAPDDSSCLDGITDYAEPGPFEFSSTRSDAVNFWVPAVPAGCKVPVVHFSNGTAASCSSYTAILERLASHGFLTACFESPRGDDGAQCQQALEAARDEYAGLAAMKFGSTGQEVGGSAAIACLYRIEQAWPGATAAGHAIAPAFGFGAMAADWMEQFGLIEAPVFIFNGSEDFLVSASSMRGGYAALRSEKYWYEATGAPHIPLPVSWAAESAVVFFRWKLLGDEAAGQYFGAMPDGDQWDVQEPNREP
jgi:hypothetical protein